MTAATAVAAFETVGSILVVAMLIVPPATAYLLTHRFGMMFVLAIFISVLSAIIGHVSAITIPIWFGFSGTSTAGAMAVATGACFFIAWIASPQDGMFVRIWRRFSMRLHVVREDILGILWRLEERGQKELMHAQLSEAIGMSPFLIKISLQALQKRKVVSKKAMSWSLTERGRKQATALIRTHRLWEVYLDKHFPQDGHQLHQSAERLEHITTTEMRVKLGNAKEDPHGSQVPGDE
jgi:manganese/zinc/iron transport system permease protein